MCVACLQPGMSPSTPTSLYVSPALSGTHTPPAPSNKAFRSELWAAGVTPDTDTGVATALPVHSRISGFGGKRLAATWLGARAPRGSDHRGRRSALGFEAGNSLSSL